MKPNIIYRAIISTIQNHSDFLFVLLLSIMIFTRYSVTYLNREQKQLLPDSVFALNIVGHDWLDGVIQPALSLLDKQPFNPVVGYGQSLSSITGLIILPLQSFGICTQSQTLSCSNAVYKAVFVLTFAGFILIGLLFPYGKDTILILLNILIFYLGIPGAMGLDRGNLDILFSLCMSLFALLRIRRGHQPVRWCITEAIVLALFVNTKMLVLPITIAFLITSRHVLLSVAIFISSFMGFSYLPVLLHMPASVVDPFTAVFSFGRPSNIFIAWCSSWNHTVYNMVTNFFDCSQLTEHTQTFLSVMVTRSSGIMIFFLIVILPLRNLIHDIWKYHKTIQWRILYGQTHKELLVLLVSLGVASINLLPYFANPYRLYYSLMAVLLSWYASCDKTSRNVVVLSSLFLLIKGLWFTDNRIINISIAFHYYFLVQAAGYMFVRRMKMIYLSGN